jgi:hypothetical protein
LALPNDALYSLKKNVDNSKSLCKITVANTCNFKESDLVRTHAFRDISLFVGAEPNLLGSIP